MGREWTLQIKDERILGAFDGIRMDAENVKVREITPKDAEREAVVQELVEALRVAQKNPLSETRREIIDNALAKWEVVK